MATTVSLKPNAVEISGSTSGTTTLQATAVAGTTTLTLPAATDTLVGKATTDTLTNKTLTGAAMNGTLGATTPSTVAATTLTTSSTVTHNGGTANGVPYLDGSKVLTTGSALVFDGTALASSGSGTQSLTVTSTATAAYVQTTGANTVNARLQSNATTASVGTTSNHDFLIQTNGTDRARIDTSGNLLVGSSSTIGTGGVFQVTSSADTSLFKCTASTTFAAIVSNVENTSARLMAFQYGSGGSPTNVGTITTNGTGVTYGTSSDYRLKENIVPMTGALDKVAQLKPVTYKWKINGSDGQGFIAHELAEVVPDAVQGEKDAVDADGNPTYQGIDTSYLVATLTAAIQEQQALITTLTARITALESA